jgi:nucleoside-diphosphate-sugar epimerase
MRIAILGATSQIAKDLVRSYSEQSLHELVLYARRPEAVSQWLEGQGLAGRHTVFSFADFSSQERFDAILNFVGVGNPAQAAAMGASIFDVTLQFDSLALDYVRQHPHCRYIFLSSGAAYGASFDVPVDESSKSVTAINDLQPQDWYGVAKMHAECRHRALSHLPIADVRVFNYFSHTQDMSARYLMTDILRAIRDGQVLQTSGDYMVRDYLHPADFAGLTSALLGSTVNTSVDCYSLSPVDKPSLLSAMQEQFGLRYAFAPDAFGINATGRKPNYYSKNLHAAKFGYRPTLTSLDGVMQETRIFLQQSAASATCQ